MYICAGVRGLWTPPQVHPLVRAPSSLPSVPQAYPEQASNKYNKRNRDQQSEHQKQNTVSLFFSVSFASVPICMDACARTCMKACMHACTQYFLFLNSPLRQTTSTNPTTTTHSVGGAATHPTSPTRRGEVQAWEGAEGATLNPGTYIAYRILSIAWHTEFILIFQGGQPNFPT